MRHKNVRPFIVKVSVLGYFPLPIIKNNYKRSNYSCNYMYITCY